jgi:RimJ/RimL family protein N-acetyltransferase
MILLETERLLFRRHIAADEDSFVQIHADPEFRRYIGGLSWPVEKARDRFRRHYLGKPKAAYGLWATILKEEDKYIGSCGLRASGRDAYLGYHISRSDWRKGFATEAAKAFLDLAFNSLQLQRVMADVEEGNVASERILQKFGFDQVKREEIPISGRVICIYELSRAAWAGREAPQRRRS